MVPVILPFVLAAVGAAAASVVVWYLTSSAAKEKASRHEKKVADLLERLMQRVRRAREKAEQAKRNAEAQGARAAEAEAEARADAHEQRHRAAAAEARVRDAEALIAELQRRIDALRQEAARATSLAGIAGTGLSVESARLIHELIKLSLFPLKKRDAEALEKAMTAYESEANEVADAAESALDDVNMLSSGADP